MICFENGLYFFRKFFINESRLKIDGLFLRIKPLLHAFHRVSLTKNNLQTVL